MKLTWFIDMDGVFVDFLASACAWYGFPTGKVEQDWPLGKWGDDKIIKEFFGLSANKFWSYLTKDFWAKAMWTADGQEFLTFMEQFNPCVLSSPATGGADGKVQWLKRHTSFHKNRMYLLGSPKHLVARRGAILIDDCEENCNKWNAAGGTAILYPRHWNSGHAINNPLEHVKKEVLFLVSLSKINDVWGRESYA